MPNVRSPIADPDPISIFQVWRARPGRGTGRALAAACAAALVVVAPSSRGAEPSPARLVGHWSLGEAQGVTTLRDASGNGRDAAPGAGVKTGRGPGRNAAEFSGRADALATFDAPALPALSAAAWVYVRGMGSGEKPYPRVIELPGAYLHVTQAEPERLGLTFGFGGGSWSGAGATFAMGEWAHVAVTCDPGAPRDPVSFFLNGARVPHALGKGPGAAGVSRAGKGTIGNTGGGGRPFCGLLADVRLYEGIVARADIAALARRTPDGDAPKATPAPRRDQLPLVDLSGERWRHVVIAAGTREIYQGHPTTLLMPDNRTLYAVWSLEHGGAAGPMARSDDAGLTWRRLDDTLPAGYRLHRNCPSLYRIVDPAGEKARIWIFTSSRGIDRLLSEDGGGTWVERPPLGFKCGMPFTGMIRLKDGRTAAFGQMRVAGEDQGVVMSLTSDGGETWTPPRVIARCPGKNLCEPFALRSPDGAELCCLMRENRHTANSMMTFSRDEGATWSDPVDTSWGLTGDRHEGVQAPDGRWVIAFRDRARASSSYGQFVAWVGTYDEIRAARPGAFRVKLLHHYGSARDGYAWAYTDTGYPGMEILPDGTIIATTYLKYWDDDRRHSVVSTRFKLCEIAPNPELSHP